jgi:CheY-like chemotaxis protein
MVMVMLETLCRPSVTAQAALSILVAEDNDVLRAVVHGLFRLTDHTVDVVCNGREAVDAAAVRDYDVIFLDVQMPEMDGLEAASRLREGRRRVRPWIVGLSGEPDHERAYAVGMDDFLVKPVRFTDLIEVLNRFGRQRKRA